MPDSAGAAGGRFGDSPMSVKPSLRGTPSLARLARSRWISTTSIPGRGKAAGGGAAGGRGGGGAGVAPPGVRHVHPVPDLQPVGTDAAMEPEGAGGDRTEEEPVDEGTSRVPLLLPARQDGSALLHAGRGRPWHEWPQVLETLVDRQRHRLSIGRPPPAENQPAAEIDPLRRRHQPCPTKFATASTKPCLSRMKKKRWPPLKVWSCDPGMPRCSSSARASGAARSLRPWSTTVGTPSWCRRGPASYPVEASIWRTNA